MLIADQLITDYRDAALRTDLDAFNARGQDGLNAIATMDSWFTTAQAHGEEFTEVDWIALVEELARRASSHE